MVSLFVFSRNKQKSTQFKALFNNIKHNDYNFTISRNYKYADFLVSFTRNDINYFINKHRSLNINYVLYSFLDEKNTEPKYYEYRGKKVYIFNTNTDNFNNVFQNFINLKIELVDDINNDDFSVNRRLLCFNTLNTGKNADRGELELIFQGIRNKKATIYGDKWPRSVVSGNGKSIDSLNKKLNILERNSFYLCNENKKLENNIEVDFWLSLQKKCLPVIRGRDWITDIFNEDSFINLNDFKNPNEVYEFIQNIPKDDYINRVNSCIEVVNNFVNSDEYKNRNNGRFVSFYNFLKDAQNGEIVLIEESLKVRKQKKRQELINRLRHQQRGRQMNRRRPPRQQYQRRMRQQQRRPQYRPRHRGNQGANRRQQHYYQRLRYLQMRQQQQQMGFGLEQQGQNQGQYQQQTQQRQQRPRKYTHRNSNWRQKRIRQLQQMKSARSQVVSNVGANNQNVVRDIVM
jgi:hypothetical protein